MDIELILYILFVVIAILTRLLKSKQEDKAPTSPEDTTDNPQERPQKRLTFEELLQEFTGEQPAREQRPQEEPVSDSEAYEDEESRFDDEETQERYKRSVSEAKALKTLDEQVDLKKPMTTSHYFKGYETVEENEVAHDILETLKDAEGAKKAIILSEIINRKY